MSDSAESPLECRAVSAENLADLARFAQAHGKFRYCACMRWRLRSADFQRSSQPERFEALTGLARGGAPIGVLAYAGETPVGWCSVAPRTQYAGLERYRGLPRLDDAPVWSVVCFFVAAGWRRQGATLALLRAATAFALAQGAAIVEGYPVEARARLVRYMGSAETFRRAGFRDVTPPGQARLVMRYDAA